MYLVQEWIYKRHQVPVEKHDILFDNMDDANAAYAEMENHLKEVSESEAICPSFVRMFQMKKSSLTKDGIGVDRCLKITYVPEIVC